MTFNFFSTELFFSLSHHCPCSTNFSVPPYSCTEY